MHKCHMTDTQHQINYSTPFHESALLFQSHFMCYLVCYVKFSSADISLPSFRITELCILEKTVKNIFLGCFLFLLFQHGTNYVKLVSGFQRQYGFNFEQVQKQPFRLVFIKDCSENMQHIYRRTPMSKCDFKKVSKQIY